MTADASAPLTPRMPPADRPAPSPVSAAGGARSFGRKVVDDTFARTGARIGIGWIAVIATFAAFAPFVASSHPYILSRGGAHEFPLFRHLNWTDILGIAIAFALVTASLVARYRSRAAAWITAGAIVAVGAVAAIAHTPPELATFEAYREDQAAGEITNVWRAPIPFSPRDRLRDSPERWESRPPSTTHLFGTTPNREDVLSRMIHACRIAISIGFISTGIAVVIGCVVGGLMGYFSGLVDIIGMRFIEIFEAIPTLFLLITFVAFYGRNLYIMMAIIGLTGWPGDARFIRAQFLQLRNQDFVHAATALGLPLRVILFRHMLPNGISPVLVTASFGVASAILFEATLSFLGLGLIDEPSWGTLLNQARGVGTDFHWWLAVFPGVTIFLTVFAYNLIGEALRDALDPKLKKRD